MTSECENREPVYTQTLDNILKVDDDKMDDLLLERTWWALSNFFSWMKEFQ